MSSSLYTRLSTYNPRGFMSDQQPTANPKRASTTAPPANKGLRSVSSLDIHTLTLDPSRPSPPPSATSPTTPWTDAIEDWQQAAAHDQDMANAQQILDTLNQLLQQNQQIATRLDQQDQALANLHAAQPNNAQIARLVTANAVEALPLAPNIVAPVNEANVITRLRYELATNMIHGTQARHSKQTPRLRSMLRDSTGNSPTGDAPGAHRARNTSGNQPKACSLCSGVSCLPCTRHRRACTTTLPRATTSSCTRQGTTYAGIRKKGQSRPVQMTQPATRRATPGTHSPSSRRPLHGLTSPPPYHRERQ